MNFVRSKVVAIVLALSMVFSVLAMPVVNAEEVTAQKTAADAAQFLQDNALLLGDESGDLGLGNSLTRAEMMVVMARLMQQEEAAAGFATEGLAFTDVTGWAAPYVAWAVDAGITKGTSENTFSPEQQVTGQQAKAFFLRALGYDVAWEEVVTKADELGISNAEVEVAVADDQPIVRGDMATMMYNTVYTETEDGSGLLGEQLGVIAPEEENAVPVLSEVKASAEVTAADTVDVTGKVEPATATVKVGTVDATVAEDGTFKATVTLDKAATDGVNNFDVVATNVDQTASETIKVTYSGALEVSKAVVVSDTAIKVTFNRAVLDTTKIKFDVTGASVLAPVATWNDAKTEAVLTNPSIILEGAYTIKVSGDTFTAGKDSITLAVIKNGIAKIEILGDKLVRTNGYEGQVSFKLTDSYGNDVTEKMSYDVNIVVSRGTASLADYKTGKVTVTLTDVAPLGSRVVGSDELWKDSPATPELVTATVYAKTVVGGTVATANAVLTVTAEAKVDAITLGAVTFPTTSPATTKVILDKVTAAYIDLKVADQFGTEILDADKIDTAANSVTSQVFYAVSDSTLQLTEDKTTDATTGKEKLRLIVGTDNMTVAKIVTITAISKATGKSSNVITLDLKKSSVPDKVTLMAPEKLVAIGDTYDEALVIPMVVFDQEGKQLTSDEIVDNADKFNIPVDADLGLKIATTGVNKGKLVSSVAAIGGTNATTKSIIVSVKDSTTGSASSTTFEVKDRAYARTIRVAQSPATNLMKNSVAKFSYEFVDQYGRVMEKAMLQLADPAKEQLVKITLTGTNVTLAVTGFTLAQDKAYELAVKDIASVTGGLTEGTSRVKAELYDKDGSTTAVVSSVETAFNVTAGVPSTMTFEIADVPTLYAAYDGAGVAWDATAATAKYGRALSITGKDASGNTYAVPFDRILDVSSSDPTIGKIAKVAAGFVDAHDNAVVVYGQYNTFAAPETATTKNVTIKVVVGTDNGPKEVTKTVTVAKAAPQAAEIVFIDKALVAAKPYTLPTDYKLVPEIYGDLTDPGLIADLDDQVFNIVYKDQYGVYAQMSAATTFAVVNTDKTNVTTIALDDMGDGTYTLDDATLFNKNQVKANTNIILMVAKDSVYGTINAKSSEGVEAADFVAPTVAAAATADEANDKVTITFSEAVVTALAETEANYSVVINGGAPAAPSLAVYDANAKTVTLTIGDLAALAQGQTVVVTVSTVTDLAGNVVSASAKTGTYTKP